MQTFYAPVQGNARAKKQECVGRGAGLGRVYRIFGVAFEMYIKKISNKNTLKNILSKKKKNLWVGWCPYGSTGVPDWV